VQSIIRRWYTVRYLAIVRLQCLVRVFLSRKRLSEKRAMHYLVTRHTSATKIQSVWRSYCAQVQMLIDIVNIIVLQVSCDTDLIYSGIECLSSKEALVLQSLWRRRTVLRLYKPLLNRIKLARERVSHASVL
jgi:hypothetical protein